jgi:hypothetical protein
MFFKTRACITVHCWGGLGSQLYSWALLEDLVKDFPCRKIKLVLHNSGVTKRQSDLDFLGLELPLESVDDFRNSFKPLHVSGEKKMRLKSEISKLVKLLLEATGFLATANTDKEYKKIRCWTTQVRGHYSYRTISKDTLLLMKLRAQRCGRSWLIDDDSDLLRSDVLQVHVRLGDLLLLKSKGPLSFERIFSTIDQYISKDSNWATIEISSDSPETALEHFLKKYPHHKITSIVHDPWNTIRSLSSGGTFIGTNSKISVWIAILKLNRDRASRVSLPNGSMNHIKHNLADFSEFKSLFVY